MEVGRGKPICLPAVFVTAAQDPERRESAACSCTAQPLSNPSNKLARLVWRMVTLVINVAPLRPDGNTG